MPRTANFKQRLKSGERLVGSWVTFNDPCATEIMCQAGFDFLIIDAEHGPVDIETIQSLMMVINNTEVIGLVRIPWNEPVIIKRVLDVGSNGILVPLVTTAGDVAQAVAAIHYPPKGIRGFGPRRPSRYGRLFKEYINGAAKDIILLVQIEHIKAVENLDEILAVAGLDGLLIGSNDLSGSMGLLGQPEHPRVLEAIQTVIKKSRDRKVPIGAACGDAPETALTWFKRGVQFVGIGSDFSLLASVCDRTVATVKAQMKNSYLRE